MFRNTKDDFEHTSDNDNLKKMQDILDGTEFPSDFDTWTVQEQSDWVYHNMTELYQNAPESLQNMTPAIFRPVDSDRSQENLPQWMDMDKYRRGQKFVRDNYFSVVLCILLGTIYGFTFDDGLRPLLISGNSNTPYLAFKRYLDTIIRILNWHIGEPWVKGTKAYRDMKIARLKHVAITTKMSRMSNEQIKTASEIANPWCPERELLLKDFAMACPFVTLEKRPYKTLEASSVTRKAINNASVACAQGAFILLSIIYPQNIGIHNVTDKDLEAFCHMWKCYGYFLGLEDEYNFCRGSLEEIKQRMRDFNQYWITPNFLDIKPDYVHATKCLVESMNYYPLIYMPHKTMALLFTEALNLKMPNLYASLNYTEWFAYQFYKFLLRHALKFSAVRSIANRIICMILEKASNFGPEKLVQLQMKSERRLLNLRGQ